MEIILGENLKISYLALLKIILKILHENSNPNMTQFETISLKICLKAISEDSNENLFD